jgi:hypothetical protein
MMVTLRDYVTANGRWSSWRSKPTALTFGACRWFPLGFPFLIDLHADPFERAPEESGAYERWAIDRFYALVPAEAIVGKFLQSFKEFPPMVEAGEF